MFYNYVIKSLEKNWFYVGFTKDIEKRFTQHNLGYVKSTKAYRPFELKFVQMSELKEVAIDLEKYLKIRWNKESLLKLLN